MSKKEAKKETTSSIYIPLLAVLLLVAAFFIGRLSSQVEMLKNGVGGGVAGTADTADEALNAAGVEIDVPGLKNLAKEIGLDEKDFDSCLTEGKYAQKVTDDLDYGVSLGVSGTPTFFINSVMVVGAQPLQIFEDVIDYELAGGNWDNPSETVAYLLDGDPQNGEIGIAEQDVEKGVGYMQGGDNAKVKIVEFSDFECPFCQSVQVTVKAILDKYGEDVSLEYRHFPLSFHANAQKAGEASECAGEQGKFWEMHDAMFGI